MQGIDKAAQVRWTANPTDMTHPSNSEDQRTNWLLITGATEQALNGSLNSYPSRGEDDVIASYCIYYHCISSLLRQPIFSTMQIHLHKYISSLNASITEAAPG